ncbi:MULTISPECIES: LWR-salt protein [Haloferax]|uniref:LWR-salt protein n=1 Tax=Haloferax marinum TaxID=2666143 RepID=A0A6A8GAZ4_9EURY|nr:MULTISPECIES: LWR-salt protein [Haloferax]KAB1198326.1 LWR-salt protein [Haloferax sp. CBA1150]MRW97423.1 LWR-salt protein [Haloferax marinum]
MTLRYVFNVRFRLETASGVRTEPREFETTVSVTPPEPGASGWMLFRDALWRGEVNDPVYACELASSWVDVPVVSCEFAELRTTEESLDELRDAIAESLDEFNATSVRDVLHKYFGSAIHVEPGDATDR